MDNLDTNAKFNGQRQQILSIRKEIRLLAQQVDYLLRNEKPLELLDVDVLMNRTHTLYDMLCAVEVDSQEEDFEEDFDEDMVNVLATAVTATSEVKEEVKQEPEPEPEPEPETPVEEPVFTVNEVTAIDENNVEDAAEEPAVEEKQPEEVQPVQDNADSNENFVMYFEDMPADNQTQQADSPIVDDYLFNMEQAKESEQEEEPVEKVFSDPIFEIVTPKGDTVVEEDDAEPENDFENDFDEQAEPIDIPEDLPDTEEVEESPVISDNQPDLFDTEVAEPEVLGEKMITEDNSLAAKLQNRPVGDLKSAIGINDKFLFVNELFGGSMEKYNRSIENLNDIQTYNGALIYLDELKVELQWNSNNMAYKKLSELVKLKFD